MSLLDLSHLPPDVALSRAEDILRSLSEGKRREARNYIQSLFPDEGPLRRELYPKHMLFFRSGLLVRERAFIAGNRVGKTIAAGAEWTYHLTGRYPMWWPGHRFCHPIRLLVSGNTHETTRDILQLKLMGSTTDKPDLIGTGLIPGLSIARWVARNHIKGAIERADIKHVLGGESELWFRSYEQGREIFEGFELDGFWADEEVGEDVWDEGQIRLMTRRGHATLTFTPLNGMTPLVQRLLNVESDAARLREVIQCGWDDVPHLSEQDKTEMLAKLRPDMRDARSRGIPSMGAGAIYPVRWEDVVVQPFVFPAHWPRAYALDVGWRRTAALWGAWDRESDVIYLYSEHYLGEAEPAVHGEAIKARGPWITGAIDPAARGRSQIDGEQMIKLYRDLGLTLILANNGVESGLNEVWQRLSTGRLKIFSTLANTRAEYQLYRRDEKGRIVKENDHLMDAMRYLCNTLGAFGLAPAVKRAEPTWRNRLTQTGRTQGSAQAA